MALGDLFPNLPGDPGQIRTASATCATQADRLADQREDIDRALTQANPFEGEAGDAYRARLTRVRSDVVATEALVRRAVGPLATYAGQLEAHQARIAAIKEALNALERQLLSQPFATPPGALTAGTGAALDYERVVAEDTLDALRCVLGVAGVDPRDPATWFAMAEADIQQLLAAFRQTLGPIARVAFTDPQYADLRAWISAFLGFQYDPATDKFNTNKHSMQSYFGYADLYELFGPALGMDLDTQVVNFTYNGKEYRLQVWKGSYGQGGAYGGEIGLYYKNLDSKNPVTFLESLVPGWYACVDPQDQVRMRMVLNNKADGSTMSNDTATYAEDGTHFWNLQITTKPNVTKSDLGMGAALYVNKDMAGPLMDSLRANSQIKNVRYVDGAVLFDWA